MWVIDVLPHLEISWESLAAGRPARSEVNQEAVRSVRDPSEIDSGRGEGEIKGELMGIDGKFVGHRGGLPTSPPLGSLSAEARADGFLSQ